MKAIVYHEFGGPDVLRLEEAEEPHAGPGQIRLKVVAAGVNPMDYRVRRGWMQQLIPPAFPAVPGLEAAGVVDEVGVQLAVARGAKVIGTAAPDNHDYLRSIGATPVAYGDRLADRVRSVAPRGIDAVYDATGCDKHVAPFRSVTW